jgi:formylmethanofuran dehydrogenase subunit E
MTRHFMLISVCGLTTMCSAGEPMHKLPQPQYERLDSDPEWLAYAAQFHGHLGPWATAGTRLGMAGLQHVGAKGYFDVQVTCEGPFPKPPKSCFLDGLQVATGATWGKRNLAWVEGEQIVVRVKNTRTGQQSEVRPTAKLLKLLRSFQARAKVGAAKAADEDEHGRQDAEHAAEAIARKIAAMPDREILTLTRPDT